MFQLLLSGLSALIMDFIGFYPCQQFIFCCSRRPRYW